MKILESVRKEILLLIRDKPGLLVLYLMPLCLIVLMALIQDAPFRDFKQAEIPVIIVDKDSGQVSDLVKQSLQQAGMFHVEFASAAEPLDVVKRKVKNGDYKAAIIIENGCSKKLEKKLKGRVEKSFSGFSPGKTDPNKKSQTIHGITIIWDPIIKNSFKRSVSLALDRAISGLQADITIDLVSERLKKISARSDFSIETTPVLTIKEEELAEKDHALYALNSVQHNVPAWTIFGIFFIVIPLSGNVIREREQKTLLRLHLIPGGIAITFISKILTYLLVAITQFLLIMLVGLYFIPLLGLPALHIGTAYLAIAATVVCLGLAAAGLGIFIGSLFSNHHQASTFGSIAVVLLAAIGGIWVPVFVMPEILQSLSAISPLGWGMNAFNDIFLRGAEINDLVSELISLLSFSGFMLVLSFTLEKFKKGT